MDKDWLRTSLGGKVPDAKFETRFWSKVNKDGPLHMELGTKCWLWIGQLMHEGYGHFTVYRKDRKALSGEGSYPLRAHRVSYSLTNGPITSKDRICHKCDNPPCVNPDHLFCGTAKDNTQDMIQKGRYVNGFAKLNKDDVKWIREWYLKISTKDIAKKFGLHCKGIGRIARGDTWKHIPLD